MCRKITLILNTLNFLYPNPKPFLDFDSPFTCLIAVLLSAQTTDLRVNQITPKLFALANTPKQMSTLSMQTLESLIFPLGLSQIKAKAILNLSKLLLERHDGLVPCSFEHLEALPGVGHKTASVILSQIFQIPTFPVDTHIHRCARRWGLSNGKSVTQTEKDLKQKFPQDSWNRVHLQILSFAREYCKATQHNPNDCPICQPLKTL